MNTKKREICAQGLRMRGDMGAIGMTHESLRNWKQKGVSARLTLRIMTKSAFLIQISSHSNKKRLTLYYIDYACLKKFRQLWNPHILQKNDFGLNERDGSVAHCVWNSPPPPDSLRSRRQPTMATSVLTACIFMIAEESIDGVDQGRTRSSILLC